MAGVENLRDKFRASGGRAPEPVQSLGPQSTPIPLWMVRHDYNRAGRAPNVKPNWPGDYFLAGVIHLPDSVPSDQGFDWCAKYAGSLELPTEGDKDWGPSATYKKHPRIVRDDDVFVIAGLAYLIGERGRVVIEGPPRPERSPDVAVEQALRPDLELRLGAHKVTLVHGTGYIRHPNAPNGAMDLNLTPSGITDIIELIGAHIATCGADQARAASLDPSTMFPIGPTQQVSPGPSPSPSPGPWPRKSGKVVPVGPVTGPIVATGKRPTWTRGNTSGAGIEYVLHDGEYLYEFTEWERHGKPVELRTGLTITLHGQSDFRRPDGSGKTLVSVSKPRWRIL